MRVLVKFSDLKKLKDENKFLNANVKSLENRIYELNSETIRLDNALDKAVEKERELETKLETAKDATEEIKLLTAENAVLIEESNKLKTYTERKQPKFWFGDRVIDKKTMEVFEINQISFKNGSFFYSSVGNLKINLENNLELSDENISK